MGARKPGRTRPTEASSGEWSILTDRKGIPFGVATDDAVIGRKRKRGSTGGVKNNQPMGLRWPVERTNSWLSNFGQLRRNTDRKSAHRLAQFALAVVFLLTAKLIGLFAMRRGAAPDR